MDKYLKWRIRCNLISLIGVVVGICGISFPLVEDTLPGATYMGLMLTAIGVLDSYGLIFPKKMRKLIEEHDCQYRDKYKSKQPWE